MTHKTETSLADLLDTQFETLAKSPLRKVRVAVLDTGIDATHPTLQGRIVRASAWCRADGDIVRTPLRRNGNNDPCGHGTGVAGVIAAIAPNACFEDFRVLDADCGGYGEVVLSGLKAAIHGTAEIINVSVAFSKELHWAGAAQLLEEAYERGKIIVAAKRNFPLSGDMGIPAELPTAISVDAGAFHSPYFIKYFRKSRIEFAARGENVVTARTGGGWTRLTGTSFATPAVSALCAILRGANRDLALFEIKSILKHHAERYASISRLRHKTQNGEVRRNSAAKETAT